LICAAAIPSFIFIGDGKLHDIYILDQLFSEAGAFYAKIAAISMSSACMAR